MRQDLVPVREMLTLLARESTAASFARHAYGGLSESERSALTNLDCQVYTGKVRDVVSRQNELLVVHSDRLTAFDKLIAMVPYKGTILTEISEFWLEEAKKVVPTHLISRPHERVLRCQKADPVRVEVIVRGYLAGSMMRAYAKGVRDFCGNHLPEGLTPYGPLPKPIITPTTKAAAFEHDEDTSAEDIVRRGLCSKEEWATITNMALTLFAHGQKVYRDVGWILVDTKYEFGRTPDGKIIVIDEIHTPDSSRLWQASSYESRVAQGESPEMLDKENVRRWLIENGFSGEGTVPAVPADVLLDLAKVYLHVAETLTGKTVMTHGPGQAIDLSDQLAH
jgi:phosphoribosylaminoimidazole-succinocarboxamide synthase